METGRSLFYSPCLQNISSNASVTSIEIYLPTSIAQSAATASCFSRFKHTSTFLGHADLDEFFFAPRSGKTFQNNDNNDLHNNNFSAVNSLLRFVRKRFALQPRAPALAFTPVSMISCERARWMKGGLTDLPPSAFTADLPYVQLPRLGRQNSSEPGVIYEVKLIARSSAAGFLFTHFMPQVTEIPLSNYEAMKLCCF